MGKWFMGSNLGRRSENERCSFNGLHRLVN
jgi:hypothetical protein